MQVLQGDNGRIAKVWANLADVESQALDQIRLMLKLPGLYKHIAVMPDVHLGKGAVVGGVVATDKVLVPNIVGVDIGCGLCAYKTKLAYVRETMDKAFWRTWKSYVDRAVPTGFNRHDKPQEWDNGQELKAAPIRQFQDQVAPMQLGTLGGGNHFMESAYDEDNVIWLLVHSGSRQTGLKIADYYNKVAQRMNERWHSGTPKELPFLPLESQEGHDYLDDMNWATAFALENRYRMLEEMSYAFGLALTGSAWRHDNDLRATAINIHHNFAAIENHGGANVIVHRKGATRARIGELGIIPGSMGTPTYVVQGKGNADSYTSCSHGAGRAMSRKAAKQTITEAALASSLAGTFTSPSTRLLDEAPGAYKNIETVMACQDDLVEIVHTLRPIITIKGDGE